MILPNRVKNSLLSAFFIGVLLLSSDASAQYQVESWTTDEGLPQNTINSISQTPDGYLWLTTLDGLVRFDGVRFQIFNKNNSRGIESNRFGKMIFDREGALWIGTEESGVTRLRDGEFQTFAVPLNGKIKPVRQLMLNPQGKIVVFTEDGIFEWNGENFATGAPFAGETAKGVALWGRTGVFYYTDKQTLHRIKDGIRTDFRLPNATEKEQFRNLFEDSRGRLWIGTHHSGLFVLENEKLRNYTVKDGLPENYIAPQMEDREGNVWAIGLKGAVIISDAGISRLSTEQGLSDDILNAIYQDTEGNVWAGGLTRGLNRINRQSVRFYSTKDGLATNAVYPIYQTADESILLGGQKMTRWSGDNQFERFALGGKFATSEITAIHQDRRGRLWIGGWGGAHYIEDGKTVDFSEKFGMTVSVMDIHEDAGGAMWFATGSGLFRWRGEQMTRLTTADGLPGDDAKVILESGGTLWIGFYGGLVKIGRGDAETGRRGEDEAEIAASPRLPVSASQVFTTADGLASSQVRSLYEDRDGVLWIGSYDGGLTRLKDGKFARFTSKDGLFNDGVFQILEDASGNLWMSSNRGIYRVSKQQLDDFAEGRRGRIESIAFGKADGLLETECNGGRQPAGIKARDGKLWFPTQRGVAVIDPENIIMNPTVPPVVIETIKIDNELPGNGQSAIGSQQSAVEIAPGKNNLEITYTGLSFLKPQQTRFRYKLAGLNDDWVEAENRRTAYFSYLPPGDYTFQVIAANADGVWNTEGAKIKFVVLPPFYRTWWFFAASFLFVGGTAFIFYRRRVFNLNRARQAQEEFSRRLLASQEQERQRIAAELHDSIGQSLLIIKNRAFLALADLDEPETVREQLEELSESATGAIEECREISYNLRPYQISRFGLTKTLEAIFSRIAEVTEIKTKIELDSIDDAFSPEGETNIYRIVQESVNNIIKHSQAAEARLNVERRGEIVEILIADDGRGFDKMTDSGGGSINSSGRGGFGLIGIAERVRMLGGSYEIESHPGKGTRINIRLHISHNNERN